MNEGIRIDCPHCGAPAQHIDLRCGFCNKHVPIPANTITPEGTTVVQEILGYKGLRAVMWDGKSSNYHSDEGVPRLLSPNFATIWEPGEWLIAEHAGSIAGTHTAMSDDPKMWPPVKGCGGTGHGCGIYAGRSREHLMALGSYHVYSDHTCSVIAQVQLAGKIIPASNGWRAQKAIPREVYVPFEHWKWANRLKEVYEPHGVVVKLETTLVLPADGAGAIKWCQKCHAKMGRTPTCPLCGHVHK